MSKLQFLINSISPTHIKAKTIMIPFHYGKEKQNELWVEYKQWLSDKTLGKPQATSKHTVKELESFGVVGVYAEDGVDVKLPSFINKLKN